MGQLAQSSGHPTAGQLPTIPHLPTLPLRSYEYCKLPPPGAAVSSKENGLAGAHNGSAASDGLPGTQQQEVALVGVDGKSN